MSDARKFCLNLDYIMLDELTKGLLEYIVFELTEPADIAALCTTSKYLRDVIANDPWVKATWLKKHRRDDAVFLAAADREEVFLHVLDMWREHEWMCDNNGNWGPKVRVYPPFPSSMPHYAAYMGYVNALRELFDAGANMTLLNEVSHMPTSSSSATTLDEIQKVLVTLTPLCLAAIIGEAGVVAFFLELECAGDIDIDAGQKIEVTWSACYAGHTDIVKLLVGAGFSTSVSLLSDWLDWMSYPEFEFVCTCPTPLHVCCHQGHAECVALLLDLGTTPMDSSFLPETFSEEYELSLHTACRRGHLNVVLELLSRGVTHPATHLPCLDSSSGTPLHSACKYGQVQVVEAILDAVERSGVTRVCTACVGTTESTDYRGETPFHTACRFGRNEVVRLLARRGVDIHRRAIDQMEETVYTPAQIAREKGHWSVVEFLEQIENIRKFRV
jgi:ankyrin repeat protein